MIGGGLDFISKIFSCYLGNGLLQQRACASVWAKPMDGIKECRALTNDCNLKEFNGIIG